jgi:hypothetical protein
MCCLLPAVVEARGLSQSISRMRRITQQLPPCLFVPHTVKAWHCPCSSSSSSSSLAPAVIAGEALATVGVTTLASLLQEGPLDERSAAYVVAMVLLGLHHLHCLGIIYRGLSAITLLMTESGLVQLVDFRWGGGAGRGGAGWKGGCNKTSEVLHHLQCLGIELQH